MPTLSLSPYRDMLSLRDAMDQLFDQSFIRPYMTDGAGFGLSVDVRAEGDDYVITAAVPGLKPEDLNVEVLGDTVVLKGELKQEREENEKSYLLRERRYGRFSRSITLPTVLNAGKADASIENGVLTLRVPKADEAKPKAISIKVKK
jgi:HSP20 family protein